MRRIWIISVVLGVIGLVVALGSVYFFLNANNAATTQQGTRAVSRQRSLGVLAAKHFEKPPVAGRATTTMTPWSIGIDEPHGAVYIAEPGCEPVPTCPSTFPGQIGKYSFFDGSFIQDFKEPTGYSSPLFLVTDATGNVWFTQPNSNAIGELSADGTSWYQWPLKKGSIPYDILLDKQGNLWFTEWGTNSIGFFNTQTHQVVNNPIPTAQSNPYGITMDRKGTIWFTENRIGLGQIGSFTPTTSGVVRITEHAVTTTQPHLITSDRAGNLWYTEAFSGSIGEYNPVNGATRDISVSTGICPVPATCHGIHISGIAVDQKGNIWFDDSLSGRVGYIVPATGKIVQKALANINAHPHDGLRIDSYNSVWFTEQGSFAVVKWPAGTLK